MLARPEPELAASHATLPWITTRPGHPYFFEGNEAWTPIGQNDAVGWPELNGLFRRRDLPGVERHLRWLRDSGVTCLRLMLEYSQGRHRYIERPAGRYVPAMVQLWDDLFAMCERVGLRILLTPFDTYFQWKQWKHHPYNAVNGGPCTHRKHLTTCPSTRVAIKARLEFATRRWGGSGVLFAWDLWNEIHPAHGGGDPGSIAAFIDDIAPWMRALELRVHGRAHPQTVSIFGPELVKHDTLREPIFRHPALDVANTHLYEKGTIDDPKDTVAPALAVGRLMRAAVGDVTDGRPLFDSEHGPIHAFLDKHRTLSEAFDDEYFRHMQWAHLASGGCGGGMRWPNRHPHVLTNGMREAQAALSRFLPLIDWTRFARMNLSEEIGCDDARVRVFACGDDAQILLWLLRTDTVAADGRLDPGAAPLRVELRLPWQARGRSFGTLSGAMAETVHADDGDLVVTVASDIAIALRRL